jgi:hypothetical protein
MNNKNLVIIIPNNNKNNEAALPNMFSSNEIKLPAALLNNAGSPGKFSPFVATVNPDYMVKDVESKQKFREYLENLFQDLAMRDNGGREMRIEHYHFLKVSMQP